ncbi:MAG: radical SAM protein, partial [Alphaproteobacteria bacterium]
ATLGMLSPEQAKRLSDSGLDYYNHNLDTSENFYSEIISTRTYADRLNTLQAVRDAGIKVCCGGILGMGEAARDRADMLVQVEGTPLEGRDALDPLDFVRTIAVAKIMMPSSTVRLSAGREEMSDELQSLCFLAGAGSIFVGPKLLTTANPEQDRDAALFRRLGIQGEDIGPVSTDTL